MTLDLPWKLTLVLCLMVAAATAPAPLWAAAIAPRPVERQITGTMNISTFNVRDTSTLWDGDMDTRVYGGSTGQWQSNQGVFSFDVSDFRGGILNSARDASVLIDGVHLHPKLDRTGFSYVNRSFGTGAAAGFPAPNVVNTSDWYQYPETGFYTNISCSYNEDIAYTFDLVDDSKSPIPLWQSTLQFANGTPINTYMAYDEFDLFAWDSVYDDATKKIQLQTFTSANFTTNLTENLWGFGFFNKIQCDVNFHLRKFQVKVNNTDKRVSSTPVDEVDLPWPTYGDQIGEKLGSILRGLTTSDGCIGGCQLGKALVVSTTQSLYQGGNSSIWYNSSIVSDDSNATITRLKGTENFFTSILDDTLVNLLLARLVSNAPQPTEETTVVASIPALVFGDRTFIIIVSILNLTISLAYIFELIRTRAWAIIPPLDIMNDSQVIIAAFEGGRLFERYSDEKSQGPSDDSISETTQLCLKYDGLESKKLVLMPQLDEE